MQAILEDIGALMGVTGSFVCGRDGGLLGRAMPAGRDDAGLTAIGRSLMLTFNGLEVDRRKRAMEFDLVFQHGLLLAVTITRPLANLVGILDKISTGKLDTPVPVAAKAETGELAESMERMRISLKAVIERLRSRSAG